MSDFSQISSMENGGGNVSNRGAIYANPSSKAPMLDVVCDLWHPDSNPDGYLSLGVAENVSIISLVPNRQLIFFSRL